MMATATRSRDCAMAAGEGLLHSRPRHVPDVAHAKPMPRSMPQRVLLQLTAPDAPRWLDLDRPQSGAQVGWPSEAGELSLLLPAESVLLARAPRVAKSEGLLRQALPFAIEDRLAAPVESLHIAFAGQGDPIDIAVIDAGLLDAQLAVLGAHGLSARAAFSEASLLPSAPGPLLVLDGARVFLRDGAGGQLCERVELLPSLLPLLPGGEAAFVESATVRVCAGSEASALPPALRRRAQAAPALLSLLAEQLGPGRGPNLLQGRFAPRLAGDAFPWLKRAAVLGALAVGLGFTQLVLERQQLQSRIAADRSAMAELLQQAMPGAPAVDPRAQLEIEYARLARGAGGDDALGLLARIAPSLAGSTRYTLESIDYRSGALDLTLRAADVATLDSLRETFVALGLAAELTSATPGQGGVEGRISLRGGRA
jgi:general secretion pathway protein L